MTEQDQELVPLPKHPFDMVPPSVRQIFEDVLKYRVDPSGNCYGSPWKHCDDHPELFPGDLTARGGDWIESNRGSVRSAVGTLSGPRRGGACTPGPYRLSTPDFAICS
jgi:hypothetical protein